MIFKPSNCYPLVSEIDLNEKNTFSCVNNTGGESAKAYKLSILDKDGENIIYEPNEITEFDKPVKNKLLIQIEDIDKTIINKVPKGTTYYSRDDSTTPPTHEVVGQLEKPAEYIKEIVDIEYCRLKDQIEEHTYYVKAPSYMNNSFNNDKDYQWNIRVYNQEPESQSLPNTLVCLGYIVGSTKNVVWLRLPLHGEGQENYDIANLIVYDRYIEITATSASQLVLGAHDDADKTLPTIPAGGYKERLKIDWVEKELGTDKDIIKIETVDPFEYNFIDGVQFAIYQCSSEHTVKSLFADPNSNVNVSQYTLVYQDLEKAQAGRDRGDLPESISLATMSGALSPCMKKVGGEDYAARKITGYSSDTGEMRFNDSFSCAPSNGEYYRLFSYNSSTKKYDPIDDAICKETHNFSGGTTITVALTQSTFISKSQGEGSYIFTYDTNGTKWLLSDGVLTTTPTFAATGITLTTNRFEFIKKAPAIATTTFTVFQSGEQLLWTLDPTQESPVPVDITLYGLTVNISASSSLTVGDKIVAVLANTALTTAVLSSDYGLTITIPSGKALATGDKISVNVQSDPLIRHNVGGTAIENSNYVILSNKWDQSTRRLFILPNINIKTDKLNPNEIVFTSNGCRVDINKQTKINTTTGKELDITFNKLDDSQWLLEGNAISYATSTEIYKVNGNILPQSDYGVYTDFADASPYNVFYARTSPELTMQIRNEYANTHHPDVAEDYRDIQDYHLRSKNSEGNWEYFILYDSVESYLRKGCVYDTDFILNKSVYVRNDGGKTELQKAIKIDRVQFVTYNNLFFWNPGTYIFSYRSSLGVEGWWYNWNSSTPTPVNLSDYGITIDPMPQGHPVIGDLFVIVNDQLKLAVNIDKNIGSITLTYDNNKLINSDDFINKTAGTYLITYTDIGSRKGWKYGTGTSAREIILADIGVTLSGTPADESTLTFRVEDYNKKRYSAAWSLLTPDDPLDPEAPPEALSELDAVEVFKEKVQNTTGMGSYDIKYENNIWKCYLGGDLKAQDAVLRNFGLKLYDTFNPSIPFTSSSNDIITVHLGRSTASENTSYETHASVYTGNIAEFKGKMIPYAAIFYGDSYYYTLSPAYDYREVSFNTVVDYNSNAHPQIKYYKYYLYSVTFVTKIENSLSVQVEVDTLISKSDEIYSSDITWDFKALEGGDKFKPNLYRITIDITDEYGAIFTASEIFAVYYDSSTSVIPLIIDYDCHELAVKINARDPLSVISTDEDEAITVTYNDIDSEEMYLSIRTTTNDLGKIVPLILDYDAVDHLDSISDLMLPEEMTWLSQFRIRSSFLADMEIGEIKKVATFAHEYLGVNYTTNFASKKIDMTVDRNIFVDKVGKVSGEYSFVYKDGVWRLYSILFAMDSERVLEIISDEKRRGEILIEPRTVILPDISAGYNNRTLLLSESGQKQDLDDLGITLIYKSEEATLQDGDKFAVDVTTTESFDLTFSYPAGYYIDESKPENERILSVDSPASFLLYRSGDTERAFPIKSFVVEGGGSLLKQDYYSLIENCGLEYGFRTSLKFMLQPSQNYEIVADPKTEEEIEAIETMVPDAGKIYILAFTLAIKHIATDQWLTQGVWRYSEETKWSPERHTMYVYVQDEMDLPKIGGRQMTYQDIQAPEGTYDGNNPTLRYTTEELGEEAIITIDSEGFLAKVDKVTGLYRFYYNVETQKWMYNDSAVLLSEYFIALSGSYTLVEGSAINVYVAKNFLYFSNISSQEPCQARNVWVDTPEFAIAQTAYDNLWLTFYAIIKSEESVGSKNYNDRISCYFRYGSRTE